MLCNRSVTAELKPSDFFKNSAAALDFNKVDYDKYKRDRIKESTEYDHSHAAAAGNRLTAVLVKAVNIALRLTYHNKVNNSNAKQVAG